ncbi:Toxin 1, PIN domain [Euzebya pacifica]|uniref:Ribonuclease VapC n=1 Tax=Euzebya pacifica TaxID=1608957 RepID=A0A346Y429_9ACTN|nr:type II toxin-antitoxin system VapC family toxin [Euzebya pacifica]AXV09226.1 Toxin 1, PIN domain [Euzebya pacifica]
MTAVPDASVVVAALVDGGPVGAWAESVLADNQLAAPHLLLVEVANILRRTSLAAQLSQDAADLAHADLLDLRVALFDYETVADRIWQLRHNVTTYDAWYVAVAERLDAPLVTLDRRLSTAAGPTCTFVLPPAA